MLVCVTAQPGIFALGTPEHCYLELDLSPAAAPVDLVRALAGVPGPLSTVAGVNCVVGLRPSLWRGIAPDDTPADAADWTDDLVGPDGFTMPATPHDAWVWLSGGDRTAVFDNARAVLAATSSVARLGGEVTGWLYRHDRDLTGFIDGTENPSLLEAPDVVGVPEGAPGAGSSVVLHQLWRHDTAAWEGIGEHGQELAMGRTKPDSIELAEDAMPPSAHVARTSFEIDGVEQDIFRRNVAYGGVTEHGTVFVGFGRDQFRLAEMLRRMAGVGDGVRCALTHYLVPLTGAYYVTPSVEALCRFAPPASD
ncbi:MAG: porphyrinogen peroxidase [Pseudonocardiales bacterium]|nr:porphyrinogen peroxidase [Pseudonocardiales bacterium]